MFLGLLTEEGRIIGFIIERLTDAHHASPTELRLCQVALSKLHNLGILHGDVNKHNFLVKDGRAILIDFECARATEDKSALREEMECLLDELGDTSGRGENVCRIAIQRNSHEGEGRTGLDRSSRKGPTEPSSNAEGRSRQARD